MILIITKKVKTESRIYSNTWRAYTGLATKGYVHRTVEHNKKECVKGRTYINGLESFFGYLKRQLTSRSRIRKSKSSLYLLNMFGDLIIEIYLLKNKLINL